MFLKSTDEAVVFKAEFTPPPVTTETWIDDDLGLAEHSLSGEGTSESPYLIANAEDLAFVSYKTRMPTTTERDNFEGKYFKQTADIDLYGKMWKPIGLTSNASTYEWRFKGNYDGGIYDEFGTYTDNNYKISNLYIYEDSSNYFGLFGGIEGGEFKNITIENGIVDARLRDYSALFAGQSYNVKIDNVSVDGYVGTFNQTTPAEGSSYVAGFVAFANTTENFDINKITNIAVSANTEIRGKAYVAGVVARNSNTIIENATNNGTIIAKRDNSGDIYAGGIVAVVQGEGELTFKNLTNNGTIDCTHSVAGGLIGNSTMINLKLSVIDSENSGNVKVGSYRAGGVIGRAYDATLINVTNSGKVEGRNELGGLVGRGSKINAQDSSNSAEIISETYNIGGLIGYVDNQTVIDNCSNSGKVQGTLNITGYNGVGGLVGVWTGRDSEITNSENTLTAEIIGASAGGAIGYTNGGEIIVTNFENYGKIVGSPLYLYNDIRGTGGVIGMSAGAGSKIEIINSLNQGILLGSIVGGAVGNAYGTSTYTIDNFINNTNLIFDNQTTNELTEDEEVLYQIPTGYLNSEENIITRYVGGVFGYNNALTTVVDSVNNGEISTYGNNVGGLSGNMLRIESNISNFTNNGNVKGKSYVGGIVGTARGVYSNVVQLGNVEGIGNNVGGIIGSAYSVTLKGVLTSDTKTVSGVSNVGGLIGYANTASVVNILPLIGDITTYCVNNASVSGTSSVGGLIGQSRQTVNIEETENTGIVNSTSYYTGGFIGLMNTGILNIKNSQNSGNVTSTVISRNAGNYNYATGGLVGHINSAGAQVKISDSQNTGNITGQFVGGIIGCNYARVLANVILTNVTNSGEILSNSGIEDIEGTIYYNYGYAGGILGASNTSGTLTLNSVTNDGAVTGKFAAGIAGMIGILNGTDVVNNGKITCNAYLINPVGNGTRIIGGLAGLVYQSGDTVELTDSKNTGQLSDSSTDGTEYSEWYYLGGLIGIARNVILNECENTFEINLENTPRALSYINYAGSLVAYGNNSVNFEIIKCKVSNIAVKADYVGGIVGAVYNAYGRTASNGTTVISECFVDANVSSTLNYNERASYVGGVIGYNRGGLELSNIVITGDICGNERIGGIASRIEMYSNVSDNLEYKIKNVSFEGNFVGSVYDSNTRIGGFIGEVYFNLHSTLRGTELPLEIQFCYNIAKFTETFESGSLSFDRYGGFVGYIGLYGSINDMSLTVTIDKCLYAVDKDGSPDGYGDYAQCGATHGNLTGTFVGNTSTTFTDADFATENTYVDWSFNGEDVETGEKTYWAIFESFNEGKPFLTNMYPCEIRFHNNDGGDDEFGTVNSLVGNQILITEKLITKPTRKYYDFAYWSLNTDGSGERYYYDETIEPSSNTFHLYAIWTPEKIFIEVGTGVLKNTEETVISDHYIERSMTDVIAYASPNEGDIFQNWEIFDPNLSEFVYYVETPQNLVLLGTGGILDDAFVDRWAFVDDEGRKSIKFRPISIGTKAFISIDFASGYSNRAIIEVDDVSYRVGTLLSDYGTAVGENSFTLKINPINHYEFTDFVIRDNKGEIIPDYSTMLTVSGTGDERTFTILTAGRYNIELNFQEIEYTITVNQVKNDLITAISTETADLVTGDDNLPTIKIGEDLINFGIADNFNYRFINFLILNNVGVYERYFYTEGSKFTEEFLNKFITNGEIEIFAVFVERYIFEIVVDPNGDGEGTFEAYIREENGETEAITIDKNNQAYIDENSNIIIIATPNSNSRFVEFTGIDAVNIENNIADFRINGDASITVEFESFYYTIISKIIDNNNQDLVESNILEKNNIDVSASVNNNKIVEGSVIYSIGLIEADKDIADGCYVFGSWYFNVDGVLIPITLEKFNITDNNVIIDINITKDFLQTYANENNEIIVVAKYFELYTLNIESSDASKGIFKLFKVVDEQKVQVEADETDFAYGTVLIIEAEVTNELYYEFVDFSGVDMELGDVLTPADKSLELSLTTNRYIVLNFVSKVFEIEEKADTSNAKGEITFSSDKVGVGDKLTVSFNVSSGYEIKSWMIIDKNGIEHDAKAIENVKYSNNTLVITIDENWLDTYGLDFNSEIKTMMNSTYFTILLAGGITIPILLAGILLFIILNNRKKAQYMAAKERSATMQLGLDRGKFLSDLKNDDKDK
jgi:hypothetical protein